MEGFTSFKSLRLLHGYIYSLYYEYYTCKDEFKIEPQYAHKKKLKQIREKTYGWSKLTYENSFTIKKPQKTEMCQISMI